jgi:hypothetical protein
LISKFLVGRKISEVVENADELGFGEGQVFEVGIGQQCDLARRQTLDLRACGDRGSTLNWTKISKRRWTNSECETGDRSTSVPVPALRRCASLGEASM